MEQAQFQSYEEGTAYKPGKVVDVIPALDRVNSRLNAADQEALAQVRRNNQTKVQNAKQAGQDLIALSKLSKTLTDALVERQEGINEDEKAEGVIEGYQQYMQGGLDTSSLQEGMQTAAKEDAVAQDVSSEVLGDSGENYEAAATISKATTWREVGRRQGAAMAAVAGYDSFIDEQLGGMQFNSSAEYAAARAQALKAFIKEAGLSGVKPQFLAQNVYPQIMKADNTAMRKWSQRFASDDSEKQRDELASSFSANLNVGSYLSAARNTVDSKGNPLGYKGAWDEFTAMVTEMRKAGMLTAIDVREMQKQPIPGDPKGRTYGDLHAAKFKNIEKQVAAQLRDDWRNFQADNQMEFEKEEQSVIDSFLDTSDTDGYTDKQLEEFATALESKYGKPASKLRQLLNSSVDAETRRKQEEDIESLVELGLLTPERLREFDPKLQRSYMGIAQQQAKLLKDSNGNQKQLDAIEDAVAGRISVDKTKRQHAAVGLMVAAKQREYQKLVTKLAIGGSENPTKDALTEILANFDQEFPKDGKEGMSEAEVIKAYSKATLGRYGTKNSEAIANFEVVKDVLTNNPDAYDEFPFVAEEVLKKIIKGYGKPGFDPGATVNYIAERLNVDPLTVLNKQLELNGMDALPPSPAMEIINNVTPEQKQLLLKYKTPERSSRGLATDGYKPEIVPGGYGEMVFNAASAHNVPPSVLAGLIETESAWNPNAVSSVGAKGLGQFMPATAAEQGVNVFDPLSSIDGAAKYLSYLIDYFKGDMRLAIFAYNGGMGNIERYGGPIPGSAENQAYYGKVMTGAYKYGYGKQSLQDPGLMRPSIAAQMPS